jgi:carbamoyl-phosphate synthase small subunit
MSKIIFLGFKIPTLEKLYSGYRAKLMLDDGSAYSGIGFGYPNDTAGEVVFNTGMVGYTETLTDPSYKGQIVCITYPLIGNYGVPSKKIQDPHGLPKYFESDRIQVKGLLIHNLSSVASHWTCIKTLDQWLYEERIPGIYGIDTRELTKRLRVRGVMMGAMSVSENRPADESRLSELMDSETYEGRNFMAEVSVSNARHYGDDIKDCIAIIDTGTKYSIIRNIIKSGYRAVVLPWDSSFEEIMKYDPAGVIISNGPGDPTRCAETIKTVAKLIDTSTPMLGICLGNQILALAAGAKTFKLKFGHRAQNKPCKNLNDGRTFITTQNHGYGISPESLKGSGFRTWFSNIDDTTVEGIEHEKKPIVAVQFHPEASPGPYDCTFVFDKFKELIENSSKIVKKNNLLQVNNDNKLNGGKIAQA